jgi:hypothetical protein
MKTTRALSTKGIMNWTGTVSSYAQLRDVRFFNRFRYQPMYRAWQDEAHEVHLAVKYCILFPALLVEVVQPAMFVQFALIRARLGVATTVVYA